MLTILNAGAVDAFTVGKYAKPGLMLQPPAADRIENETWTAALRH
jgi:hypothetical protein